MWKITLGVAFGIVLAGIIIMFGFIFFTGSVMWGFNEAIKEQNVQAVQHIQQLANYKPLTVVPITTMLPDTQQQPGFIQAPSMPIIPKTREDLVREKSKKAYINVRKEVEDFKLQYKKPPECYDLKDSATRIHCANAFIKAREAYEALNK